LRGGEQRTMRRTPLSGPPRWRPTPTKDPTVLGLTREADVSICPARLANAREGVSLVCAGPLRPRIGSRDEFRRHGRSGSERRVVERGKVLLRGAGGGFLDLFGLPLALGTDRCLLASAAIPNWQVSSAPNNSNTTSAVCPLQTERAGKAPGPGPARQKRSGRRIARRARPRARKCRAATRRRAAP
jgi:hypothetical protein